MEASRLKIGDIGYAYFYFLGICEVKILQIDAEVVTVWYFSGDEGDRDNFEQLEIDHNGFVDFFETEQQCEDFVADLKSDDAED